MTRITFGRQVCGNLAEAASREWLVVDGLGGYAMGTVAGLRTRRYHGLLVVAGAYPGARRVGLAALEPVLVIGDRRVRLATDEWAGGAVDPAGHEHLARFDLEDGVPRWQWSVGGVVIEREIAMMHGRSLVAVTHRVLSAPGDGFRLELTPLCTWRDAHAERVASGEPSVSAAADGFVFEGAYRVAAPGAAWAGGGTWYRGAFMREEAARGLAAIEDLWAAGRFSAHLTAGGSLDMVCAASPFDGPLPTAADIVAGARSRSRALVAAAASHDETDALLVAAADQFVVTTPDGPDVVAGYPWFGAWSRDTMVSYEGLFLETNRTEEGRALLLRSAAALSEGMLANTADTGAAEYNSADGTLWFVHALNRHVERSGDVDLARSLAGTVDQVIEYHVNGTRYGIKVDPADGLLSQGAEGWALTWMDARVDGRPITPRPGKAVEINALWVNALGAAAALGARVRPRDGHASRWELLEARARTSFASRFLRPDGLGMFDVIDGRAGPAGVDAPEGAYGANAGNAGNESNARDAIRPNQLLALSLPFGPGGPSSVLDVVLDVVRDELLTSIGVRSLAPSDPSYRGRHRGDVYARDDAYHQGTVWPWLLGPYVDACLRAGRPVIGVLDGIEAHLREWGIGSVSETADGDPPHAASGCPFQAWSVAEVLRVRRLLANR